MFDNSHPEQRDFNTNTTFTPSVDS